MCQAKENKKAFPNKGGRPNEMGMDLRDYFAAIAMQGTQMGLGDRDIQEQARLAYKIADAMLKERDKENG